MKEEFPSFTLLRGISRLVMKEEFLAEGILSRYFTVGHERRVPEVCIFLNADKDLRQPLSLLIFRAVSACRGTNSLTYAHGTRSTWLDRVREVLLASAKVVRCELPARTRLWTNPKNNRRSLWTRAHRHRILHPPRPSQPPLSQACAGETTRTRTRARTVNHQSAFLAAR